MKIIFKDGKEYFPYDYSGKENELEANVIDHSDIIFGKKSIFLEKIKIDTWENEGTIPDGFIILLDEKKWYIVEIELNEHSFKRHIVPQLLGFIGSIDISKNKISLINAFYSEIKNNDQLKSKVENIIEGELYKFLSDVIHKIPEIVIIIDKYKVEFKDLNSLLKFPYYILEFQTFYHSQIDQDDFINSFNILKKIPKKIHPRHLKEGPKRFRRGSEGLGQIIEVASLVYDRNIDYIKAVNIVATNRRITVNSVRDKCTRKIGLKTHAFVNLLKDKEQFKAYLIKLFPNEKSKIIERLNN